MPEEKEETTDLGQFKTPEDLLKSYKEIQAAFTKVSQENKTLKEQGGNPEKVAQLEMELQSIREEAELLRLQSQAPENTQRGSKTFDESWMESPEAAIDERVSQKLAVARINDALEEENLKNPVEYPERYKAADALATRYPNLAKSPQGVHKLFEMADELRKQQLKETSKKTLEYLLGENPSEEQLAKFKKLLLGDKKTTKTNNDAYMPDGSTSTKSGADSDADQDNSVPIREAVKRGDVDGVLQEMFKNISA
jgi:hypothetical protein